MRRILARTSHRDGRGLKLSSCSTINRKDEVRMWQNATPSHFPFFRALLSYDVTYIETPFPNQSRPTRSQLKPIEHQLKKWRRRVRGNNQCTVLISSWYLADLTGAVPPTSRVTEKENAAGDFKKGRNDGLLLCRGTWLGVWGMLEHELPPTMPPHSRASGARRLVRTSGSSPGMDGGFSVVGECATLLAARDSLLERSRSSFAFLRKKPHLYKM